jgi:hypothetical protein
MRLAKRYSPQRLERACARALLIRAYSFKSIESILKKGLDQQESLFDQDTEHIDPLNHSNIRGKKYYH